MSLFSVIVSDFKCVTPVVYHLSQSKEIESVSIYEGMIMMMIMITSIG
jgi:hypothetical protein